MAITVNIKAKEQAIQNAISIAIRQATEAANAGQERVTLYFDLPNYGDSTPVMDKLNSEGVYCVERGLGSDRNIDGSYSFRISCTIGFRSRI